MLIYSAICSLDGYVEDADGKFDWARPSEELHAYVNERESTIGTYLYGRRMYETMAFWETMDEPEPVMREYAAIWRAAEKIVFSRTLEAPRSARTRIEREFDPAQIGTLKTDASIGGAELAGQAIAAGIVDRVDLYVCPVIVGGGKRALPSGVRLELELVASRSFEDGAVHLAYAR